MESKRIKPTDSHVGIQLPEELDWLGPMSCFSPHVLVCMSITNQLAVRGKSDVDRCISRRGIAKEQAIYAEYSLFTCSIVGTDGKLFDEKSGTRPLGLWGKLSGDLSLSFPQSKDVLDSSTSTLIKVMSFAIDPLRDQEPLPEYEHPSETRCPRQYKP